MILCICDEQFVMSNMLHRPSRIASCIMLYMHILEQYQVHSKQVGSTLSNKQKNYFNQYH